MIRIVERKMPDGTVAKVQPFHVSMKGLENALLCRDTKDYDAIVKYMAICARRKNVIIIIYAVVSNHGHAAVLAISQADADMFGEEWKRMCAMWLRSKYKEKGILKKVDTKAILLDDDWYVRRAMAYIPRNAIDNKESVQDYPWSGFRAMFRTAPETGKRVAFLTKREREAIMHTGDSLKDVPWVLDDNGFLIPDSFCDKEYLEQVFNHDQAFFLRLIGDVDVGEMQEKLEDAPRTMLKDSDFYKFAEDCSLRWFKKEVSALPIEKKMRLLSYLWRSRKTTVNQLARVLGLERESVRKGLRKK